MHEFSLVRTVIAQVRELIPEIRPEQLQRIRLVHGPLSGFDSLLASRAFEQLRSESGMQACQLEIEEQPLRAKCERCEHDFDIVGFQFECPHCGHREVDVIQGEDVRIVEVCFSET